MECEERKDKEWKIWEMLDQGFINHVVSKGTQGR